MTDTLLFEKLYSECFGALQRFCYYKLPNKSDGDDVIQEVALAAWANRESVRNINTFKSWLLRIAANKCNDFYRKHMPNREYAFDETIDIILTQSRYGLTTEDIVRDTIDMIGENDSRILNLFYIEDMPQAEIANLLGIPLGTVKSRLYNAKQRFREVYPFPPKPVRLKGDVFMSKLPEILPQYSIVKSDSEPFDVRWEENIGFFFVPKLGEKLSWAMYDYPGRTRSEMFDIEVTGKASVHGIEGVEVVSKEYNTGNADHKNADCTRTFVAQLTDTHCRILSESHTEGDIKRIYTFLDSESFIPNWGFGEDNCGKEINIKPKGIIRRDGDIITSDERNDLLDVVGRYTVTIGGKEYDCICVMDIVYYNSGVVSEQFIDKNGRTVLWRRFNHDDWNIDHYKQKWSERLPDNSRLTVNGELYVHWYDCITDYIL